MAIICREHKLLFIMVPGTGCSVVGRVLQQELDGEWFPEQDVRNDGNVVVQRKHNSLPEILQHGLLTEQERAQYLVFATVRNPFDRWVTYYQRYVGEWVEEYAGFAKRQIERDREAFDYNKAEYERRLRERDGRVRRLRGRKKIMRTLGFNFWMKGTLIRWYAEADKSGWGGALRPYAFPMLEGVDVVIRQERLEEGLNRVLEEVGIERRVELPKKNVTPGKKAYTDYYSHSTRWLASYLLNGDAEAFGYAYEGIKHECPMLRLTDILH